MVRDDYEFGPYSPRILTVHVSRTSVLIDDIQGAIEVNRYKNNVNTYLLGRCGFWCGRTLGVARRKKRVLEF